MDEELVALMAERAHVDAERTALAQLDGARRALDADALFDLDAAPERVAVVGDWHGQEGAARWALREARRRGATVVVHTGDFGIWPKMGGVRFLDAVEEMLAAEELTLLFIDGNHEDFDQLATYPVSPKTGLRCVRPRLYHLPRGFRWTWGGLRWLALGGATSLDRPRRVEGVTWWAQEVLSDDDVATAVTGGDVDVMVTHDTPSGYEVPGLPSAANFGDRELALAGVHREVLRRVVDVVRPTHLFHGHFHSRYTRELDLGGGLSCEVTGLDRDGTCGKNIVIWDTDVLLSESTARRP